MQGKISPIFWVGLSFVGIVVLVIVASQKSASKYLGYALSAVIPITTTLEIQRQARLRQPVENWTDDQEPEPDFIPIGPPPMPPLPPFEMGALVELEPPSEPEPLKMMDFEE